MSLCIFMVLAVLAGGIVIVKINSYKSQQTIDSENYARTVFVEKGEINRSINVNGKIESAEVSMVSTSLTEKVKSVNVKVGDYVKAGDVIQIPVNTRHSIKAYEKMEIIEIQLGEAIKVDDKSKYTNK